MFDRVMSTRHNSSLGVPHVVFFFLFFFSRCSFVWYLKRQDFLVASLADDTHVLLSKTTVCVRVCVFVFSLEPARGCV